MATKRVLTAAFEVGESMADTTLARRKKLAASRAKVIARHHASAGVERSATVAGGQSVGVIVAEGDSWFDYPLHDVLSDLEDSYGYDVESVARRGDRVEDMAYSDGQLDDFTRRIQKVVARGDVPKAILLSGGGNDIAGDEFAMLLNHAASSIRGLNESVVSGIIDQRLFNAYATILASVSKVCRELTGQVIPILVHGYGYAVPDGRGFLGGFWLLPGPWLEPGFRQKGYAKMSERQPLVNELIDRFNTMLIQLTKDTSFGHVEHVDLRTTLSDTDYKDMWANELHPTKKGFAAVTAKFVEKLP
ncbi:GDSL-like lipase/acylhydrolase family protein [Luteibacter rhizovicinus]|uniref:GDSL-like lipase/acylhydrolase family protein n=1 Tax=Luteibacter rhizovicinus TaxID=242606 RepID=A0A4R3YKD3_9GAMM|nr:SGNH/GDSL hydrolase family protein [Luteibacter rhizovicinus]TCV93185.1 GDSL-like lipase/acylhydrolase family protein [Luteibacter rhizovicinus]